PESRYVRAADVAAELRRYLDGEPVEARPLPWLERLRRWVRRQPLLAFLSGTIVVLSILLVSLVVTQAVQYVQSANAQQRDFEKQQWGLYAQSMALAHQHIRSEERR